VAVGRDTLFTNAIAFSSDNGATWTTSSNSPFAIGFGIAWSGTYFYASGWDNTVITTGTLPVLARSSNGVSWTTLATAGGYGVLVA
jgi:hypothetical protein